MTVLSRATSPVWDKYFLPDRFTTEQKESIRKSPLWPLAVDICKTDYSADIAGKIFVSHARAVPNYAYDITLSLANGYPLLKIASEGGTEVKYSASNWYVNLKSRGHDHRTINSGKMSRIRNTIRPFLPSIVNSAENYIVSQVTLACDFYTSGLRSTYGFSESNDRVNMTTSDLLLIEEVITGKRVWSSLPSDIVQTLECLFTAANKTRQAHRGFFDKLNEFLTPKWVVGWAGEYGIYIGTSNVGRKTGRVAQASAADLNLQLYRSFDDFAKKDEAGHRELMAALMMLKVSETIPMFRDTDKIIPWGDYNYPNHNAVAYYVSGVEPHSPQWIILDRLTRADPAV